MAVLQAIAKFDDDLVHPALRQTLHPGPFQYLDGLRTTLEAAAAIDTG